MPFIVWSAALKASGDKPASYDGLVSLCDIIPTALKHADPSANPASFKLDGSDLMRCLLGHKPPPTGRRYVNLRTLNHRFNTWDGGRDTKGKTTGSCIALLVDDYKIMRQARDAKRKDEYSYQLQRLPDMIGKPMPRTSLVEDYYQDNISDPQRKEAMIHVPSSPAMQRKHPAFVVAPQCPEGGKRWVNHNWSDGAYDSRKVAVSNGMTLALSIVEQLLCQAWKNQKSLTDWLFSQQKAKP